MMSAHRNPRRRKNVANQLNATTYRSPFAAGISLNENPNRGKRRLSYATRVRLTDGGERIAIRQIPQSL